jgi:hypothetical protein
MQPNPHKRRVRLIRRAVARFEGLVRLVGSQIGSDDHLRAAANEVVEPLLQALGRADRLLLEVGRRDLLFAGEAVSPPAPADESLAAMLTSWHVTRIVVGRKLYASHLLGLCAMLAKRERIAPGEILLGMPASDSRPVPLDSVQGLLRGYLDDSSSALSAVARIERESSSSGDSTLEAWLHDQAAEVPSEPPERVGPPLAISGRRAPEPADGRSLRPRSHTETPTLPSGTRKRPEAAEKPKKKRRKHMTGNMDVKMIEGEESWMDKFNDSALDTDVNGILDDLL